jgi:aspartate aminotransferase-like enzyme
VAHLVDSDLVYADRMKRVIAEDEPPLVAFDENRWIAGLDSQHMPVADAVNLFSANREWIALILRKGSEATFARFGNHSEVGRQTLTQIVTTIANHLDHHLRFLYAKRGNLGIAITPRYTAN